MISSLVAVVILILHIIFSVFEIEMTFFYGMSVHIIYLTLTFIIFLMSILIFLIDFFLDFLHIGFYRI